MTRHILTLSAKHQLKSIKLMEKEYKLLPHTHRVFPLYTQYSISNSITTQKTHIFFNDIIDCYKMRDDLYYHFFIFRNSNHPHLLNMEYYLEYDNGQQHIYEDYGVTLEDYCRNSKTPMGYSEMVQVLKDVIEGIYGVIDRGYYPQNVRPEHFVLAEKRWKIRCVVFEEDEEKYKGLDSEFSWKKEYCPPELQGNLSSTQLMAQIVWSVGSIALFLLRKEHTLNSLEAIHKVISHNFKDLDQRVGDFLRQCLSLDPLKRITFEELSSILSNNPLEASSKLLSLSAQILQSSLRRSKGNKSVDSKDYFNTTDLNNSMRLFKQRPLLPGAATISDFEAGSFLRVSVPIASLVNNINQRQLVFIRESNILIRESNVLPPDQRQNDGQSQDNQSAADICWQFRRVVPISQPKSPPLRMRPIEWEEQMEIDLLKKARTQEVNESIVQVLYVYKEQRQRANFLFRIAQDASHIEFPQEKKVRGPLVECSLILAAICFTNPVIQAFNQGKTSLEVSNSQFKCFKNSIYFQEVKKIFVQMHNEHIEALKNEIKNTETIFPKISDQNGKFYLQFLKDLMPDITKMTLQDLHFRKSKKYNQFMTLVYQFCKEWYTETSKAYYLSMMIKLLVSKGISKVLTPSEKEMVFKEFFDWKKARSQGAKSQQFLSMREYLEFLDKCEQQDKQTLVTHKEAVKFLTQK